MKRPILKSILYLIFILGFFGSCSKIFQIISPPKQKPGFVVIFVNGAADILREGKKAPATLGMILQKSDKIITKTGTVDLQTDTGHVVRLKPFTQLKVDFLQTEFQEETTLALENGLLLLRMNKLGSKESFKITTPTAIAAVRGTAFSFEVVEGTLPKIKVYEGLVAMTLRAPVSKEISGDTIAQKPQLQKFQKLLEENEIIIAENEEAQVKPQFEELVQIILTRLDQKTIEESIKNFEKDGFNRSFSKSNFIPSPQENADLETLVKVDEDIIDSALLEKSNPTDIKKDHDTKLDSALTNIETSAKEKNLGTEGDIKNFYSILETVHKTDDSVLSGAIVTQIGETLLLHTTDGVFRLKTSEIKYVEYKNFSIVTKKKDKTQH